MSTRSDIIVHRTDGKWSRAYCHHDGYLEHVGAILHERYNSQERAEELVSHGDMSSLAARCDKPEGHSYDTRASDCTVYYGRDRGEPEEETAAKVGHTLEEIDGDRNAFTYLWDDGRWWLLKPGTRRELAAALRNTEAAE